MIKGYKDFVTPQIVEQEQLKSFSAIIFSCSLKSDSSKSMSHYIAEIVKHRFEQKNIQTEIVYIKDLEDFNFGVEREVEGVKDSFTPYIDKIINTNIVIIATPIWWGVHSSLAQAVLERLTWFDDEALRTNHNILYGKLLGTIISGAEDGWQHIQGNMFNFASELGFTVPPKGFISSNKQKKREIDEDKNTQDQINSFITNIIELNKVISYNDLNQTLQPNGFIQVGTLAGKN